MRALDYSQDPSNGSSIGTIRTVRAADLKANIVNIDIAGTIATVRLELDNWTGTNYTDVFTLLKVDGHWKIMNKVFHINAG
jgi:hypothetical protein